MSAASIPSRRLRITLLVPMPANRPAGGFKVTYEYGNYLARRGHRVNVVHGNLLYVDKPLFSLRPKAMLRTIWKYFKLKFTRGYRPDSWFTVDPAVNMVWAPSLAAQYLPDADVVVATAWETAEWALTYPPGKGRLFYLIQHLETWSGPEERVMATWTAPLTKIVIAPWLQRIATDLGETSHLIPNGLDFSRFSIVTPPEDRDPNQLLMLYHFVTWKGSDNGLAAFVEARELVPGLKIDLFGIDLAPPDLPEGATYYHQPSPQLLKELYNKAAIFVSPAWAEGWALPPAEALTCGCALAVTDIGGHQAYAIPEQTALLSPIKNPVALAANIVRLVRDHPLRLSLAHRGNKLIHEFTWDRAGAALEALILDESPASAALEHELATASTR